MAQLTPAERRRLPDSAFAYIDGKGKRRLPIYDESHVRNALARFDQVVFATDAERATARRRLLAAARKFGIVPIGFMESELATERTRVPRTPADLPTGMVTLMFTDIEGSTRLLEALGDGYPRVLQRVRRAIRKAVAGAGGRMVEVRADESFSVFTRPRDAVAAAVALQRALTRPPSDPMAVRVRAGMHHGSVSTDDTGYVGLAVHAAARISAAAHGGQVVVSTAVRTAMRPAIPGVEFRSLGRHRLAGFRQPIELFQVEADGLATEFPPLRRGSSSTLGRG